MWVPCIFSGARGVGLPHSFHSEAGDCRAKLCLFVLSYTCFILSFHGSEIDGDLWEECPDTLLLAAAARALPFLCFNASQLAGFVTSGGWQVWRYF